jgi:hypothetical protein
VLSFVEIIGKKEIAQTLNTIGPIILNHFFADGENTGTLNIPKSDPEK